MSNNIIFISAQDSGRFINIRQIVKDTLDYVRTVPAPEPFRNMLYNPVIQQQTQQLPIAAGQSLPLTPAVFSPPSKNDVDKLFHLPADILEKLASDAGYITESPRQYAYKDNGQSPSNSQPSLGGFNFNVANDNGRQPTMQEIIEQLQSQVAQNQQTTTIKPNNNVQVEPMTTVPTDIRNAKVNSAPTVVDPNTINLPPFMNSGFNILSSNNEKDNNKNEEIKNETISTTTQNVGLVQQPETTTSTLPKIEVNNNNLHGQEIILNGQKYILAKPESIKNLNELRNNHSTEKEITDGEIKSSELNSSSKDISSSENNKSDDISSNASYDKSFSQEKESITTEEPLSITSTNIQPATKTVISETGGFIQSEVVKDSNKKELPKSLETLLMETLEKEQIKAAEEQRKFLLRQRTTLSNDNDPNILSTEPVLSPNTIAPLSIRKLPDSPKQIIKSSLDKTTSKEKIIETTTKTLDIEDDRVEQLRKSFNEQRRVLAFKSRQLFTRNRLNKKPQPFLATTYCQTLRDFSKYVGISDIVELAGQNCKLIANYYPDLTCDEVVQYAEHCSLLMKLEKKN
uniref:aECM cysteine-cradle domain-containing protein n=1 Tax=Parastrongyloides trichosuri TaxID=131310 RepID=A0A0N4ZBA8_PARTI